MTQLIIDKLKLWCRKNYYSLVPDWESMGMELVLVWQEAEEKWDGRGNQESFIWWQIRRRAIDYVRKHGSYTRRGNQKQFLYPVDLSTLLALPNTVSSTTQIYYKYLRTVLKIKLTKILTAQEMQVINMYYWEGFNFAQIGLQLNLSNSRIIQIQQKAIGKLQTRLKLVEI